MFKCEITGEMSRPGEKMTKVVALSRPKIYEHFDADGKLAKTTRGVEIVRELKCSVEGVKTWYEMSAPEQYQLLTKLGYYEETVVVGALTQWLRAG